MSLIRKPSPRETETVKEWTATTMALIQAAADYASSGEDDPEVSAMIRKLRVTAASFMAALQAIPALPVRSEPP
jgi:hypothetical protein